MTTPLLTALDRLPLAAGLDDAEAAADRHADADVVDNERGPDARALARLEDIADEAQDFARRAKAVNTLKAYRNDWDDFCAWCGLHRLEPLPAAPQTIALYLADLSKTHKVSTLYRRLSGISQAHQAAGHQPSPTRDPQVRLVFQGIRRTPGAAPDQKHPAITAEVRAMVETLKLDTLIGARDRALLLIGFAGAFRRSELVSLDVDDVSFTADGLVVHPRRSKTDQEAVGRKVGLPFGSNPLTCPVRALREWLERGCMVRGPIFRPRAAHFGGPGGPEQPPFGFRARCSLHSPLRPLNWLIHPIVPIAQPLTPLLGRTSRHPAGGQLPAGAASADRAATGNSCGPG